LGYKTTNLLIEKKKLESVQNCIVSIFYAKKKIKNWQYVERVHQWNTLERKRERSLLKIKLSE